MKNIKKFEDFVNEKKSNLSKKELKSKYNEFAKKALEKINKELSEKGKGKIMLIDLTDSDIKKELNDKEKDSFIKISKQLDKIDGYKVDENLDVIDPKFAIIAAEVEKGFTNGEDPVEWELEVNAKDWIWLEDDEIDMIAAQIRSGAISGEDPIDWLLDFQKDSFDVEEEEEYARKDIANQLEIDEEDFEDSSSLGDMADRMSDEMSEYDYAFDEAKDLFNAYIEHNDVSKYFTKNISKEFEYNKEESLFNNVIKYYTVFEKEFGYLEEFNTSIFNDILKDIIKKFLKNGVTEKKQTTSKLISPVAIFQEKNKKGEFIGKKIFYYKAEKDWWYVTVGKEFQGDEIPKYNSGKTGNWKNKKQYPTIKSLEEYHKQDNIFKVK